MTRDSDRMKRFDKQQFTDLESYFKFHWQNLIIFFSYPSAISFTYDLQIYCFFGQVNV